MLSKEVADGGEETRLPAACMEASSEASNEDEVLSGSLLSWVAATAVMHNAKGIAIGDSVLTAAGFCCVAAGCACAGLWTAFFDPATRYEVLCGDLLLASATTADVAG